MGTRVEETLVRSRFFEPWLSLIHPADVVPVVVGDTANGWEQRGEKS
jgi:hypothetical protein